MKTKKRVSTRKSAALSESVNKRLTAYALAAGAAGVGVLALAEPARADIITVKTPISFSEGFPCRGRSRWARRDWRC